MTVIWYAILASSFVAASVAILLTVRRSELWRLPVRADQDVQVPVAGKVILHLAPPSKLLDLTYGDVVTAHFELLDAAGRAVESRPAFVRTYPLGRAIRSFVVPTAGRYRLRVDGLKGDEPNTHQLILTKPYLARSITIAAVLPLVLVLWAAAQQLTRGAVVVPDEYVGDWSAPGARLVLSPTRVSFRGRHGGVATEIDMPLAEFASDHFATRFLFLGDTWRIEQQPQLVDGEWRMVVDGVEFRRR